MPLSNIAYLAVVLLMLGLTIFYATRYGAFARWTSGVANMWRSGRRMQLTMMIIVVLGLAAVLTFH